MEIKFPDYKTMRETANDRYSPKKEERNEFEK